MEMAIQDTLNTRSIQNFSLSTFLLGGFSIFTCLAFWAFVDKNMSVMTISQLGVGLSFIVNYPHFLASYLLLYSDFKKNIFKNFKYFWAAIIVPAILIGYLFYCLYSLRTDLLGYCINAMFFLVGWHYVKQIFGVVIVTSALKKFYYSKTERLILLTNLFALWAISFLNSQTYLGRYNFYGISYVSYGFSKAWLTASFYLFYVSTLSVLVLHVRKYIKTGAIPSIAGGTALAALYIWYLPAFYHPHFAYLIPFFHSLQYLVFVWSFKKNQVQAQTQGHTPTEVRRIWMQKFAGYLLVCVILGYLFFDGIPNFLDAQIPLNTPALGSSPIVVAFLLFINIHHYFIDNVIWKSSNEEIRHYLFAS